MPAETPAERGRRLVDGHDDGHDDHDDAPTTTTMTTITTGVPAA